MVCGSSMMMGRRGSLVLFLLLVFSTFAPSLQEDVTISVEGVTTIGRTDDSFICATLDWWPPQKCDYNMCPWGQASLLNLDLKNPILYNAIKAFESMRIRLGGSLQDQIVYKVGPNPPKCHKLKQTKDGMFGFSEGCLRMCRWNQLNDFLNRTGAQVTFGLNALAGRTKVSNDTLYAGKWDDTNARHFINYTIAKGFKIDSWEFGNELSGSGVSARVDPKQYGEDLIALKGLLNDLYKNSESEPKLLAPGGFFDQDWFAQMLRTSGPDVLDVVTHHIYNLGAGVDPDLIHKIQDPYFLDRVSQTYKDVETTIRNYGPWTSAWIGESGGAYNSGGKEVSHTFVDSFWYLDQLGMTSTFDHKVFCRQALIGGNYALLNTTTFIPNPDYYSALMWHRLMGPGVLRTTHNSSAYLRSYAHCSKDKSGVTLLMINLSNSTAFDVSVVNDMNLYPPEMLVEAQGQREEYYLTPKDGDIQSDVMLLNGRPLSLTSNDEIPEMYPLTVDASAPLHIAPLSIAFIKFNDFNAPACSN